VKRLFPRLVLALGMVGAVGLCASPPGAEAEIRKLLADQVSAWNRGDVRGFMQGYWQSSQTTFSGANGTLRGWQAVFDRYSREYPNRQARGALAFSHLEIIVLTPDAALVCGEWALARASDHPSGVFTLVLRKLPEGWRIIHDHTSAVSRQ